MLARAYPERIAGTNARWSFDDKRARFVLGYTPRGSAPTVLVMPKRHFPHGVCWVGRGFEVRADPDSTRLRLHAKRGARHVSFVAFPCKAD